MKMPTIKIVLFIAVLCILILACGLPIPSSQEVALQSTIDTLRTQNANQGAPSPERTITRATQAGTQPAATEIPPAAGNPTPGLEGQKTFSLLGQIGGSSAAVAVDGQFAYLGQGPRMVVLDVSDPAKPGLVGESEILPGLVQGIQVNGNYAYAAVRYGGLYIFDIQNPKTPSLVSSVKPKVPGCNAVALQKNLAYLACNPAGLFIVDISDPQKPAALYSGDKNAAMLSIAVVGNFAYLVDVTSHGLLVMDASNPSAPKQAGLFKGSDVPEASPQNYGFASVRTCGNYLCLAADQEGLVVLNISNPTKPVFVGQYDTQVASGLAVSGNMVYVIDDMDGMHIVDISKPDHPKQSGVLPTSVGGFEFSVNETAERGVFIQGKTLYITDQVYGLTVVDVSQGNAPKRIGHYQTPVPDWLREVRVVGNYAYIIGRFSGFRVVDISDPAHMRETSYDDRRKNLYLQNPSGLEIQGNFAYISDTNYPFHIYDLSDPAKPVESGAIFDQAASDGAFDIAVAGQLAYLSGEGGKDAFYPGNGIWVIDISNPQTPKAVKFVKAPNERWQISLDGSSLYLLDGGNDTKPQEPLSLRVYNLDDSFFPVETRKIVIPVMANLAPSDILATQGVVYLNLFPHGLQVWDVSNPSQPGLVQTIPVMLSGGSVRLAKKDNTLIAGGSIIYDISDPQKPQMIWQNSDVIEAWNGETAGDLVYIVTKFHGLYVYRYK